MAAAKRTQALRGLSLVVEQDGEPGRTGERNRFATTPAADYLFITLSVMVDGYCVE